MLIYMEGLEISIWESKVDDCIKYCISNGVQHCYNTWAEAIVDLKEEIAAIAEDCQPWIAGMTEAERGSVPLSAYLELDEF